MTEPGKSARRHLSRNQKLAAAALVVIAIIAIVSSTSSSKHNAAGTSSSSTTTTSSTKAPSTSTPPAAQGIGRSLAGEETWLASLGVGAITWKSAPLTGGIPRALGTDKANLITFELTGPPSDLIQEDVEAFTGTGSSAIASNQTLALGELPYHLAGRTASLWLGSEISKDTGLRSLKASRVFGKNRILVQITAALPSIQVPAIIYVQVTHA